MATGTQARAAVTKVRWTHDEDEFAWFIKDNSPERQQKYCWYGDSTDLGLF